MQIRNVIFSCFSPTRSSYTYARAFAKATGLELDEHSLDVTYEALTSETLAADTLLVVAVPVYGGDVPSLALKRLKALHGEGTPAVVLAVYGNRDFGRAPSHLASFLEERGFVVVAAGAFVAEHSYSSIQTPIAAGRPTQKDLDDVAVFAKKVACKLKASERPVPVDASRLKCPSNGLLSLIRFALFVVGYRRRSKRSPIKIAAVCDPALCKSCGHCVQACPVGAIPMEDPHQTDGSRCIKCAACVKSCAYGARSIATPFALVLSNNFHRQKPSTYIL